MNNKSIDNGRTYDWTKSATDYGKYRDIYPAIFYKKIYDVGVGLSGQKVLDIGTGTGVIPRNMYSYGATFTGVDASAGQINVAEKIAQEQNMKIDFICTSAEKFVCESESFDAVIASQCFTYFDDKKLAPLLSQWLKTQGKVVILYMAWLPYEDEIAKMSETLVRKYNPDWTGYGEQRHKIIIPDVYKKYFDIEKEEIYDVKIPFTKESWNGRMKACRGVGATLSQEKVQKFEREHMHNLNEIADESFNILHYVSMTVLKKKVED